MRRVSSQQMPPPPVPPSPSINVLPSNQDAVNNISSPSLIPPPSLPPNMIPTTETPAGPGPTRFPEPLTAADLHNQLEKEQEAVVNRLTRELSHLRAMHNASTVSNASSASATLDSALAPVQAEGYYVPNGPGIAHHQRTPAHHRTSSNASARSLTAIAGSASTSMAGISSPAPVRPGQPALGAIGMSRQGSSASRRSRAGSPSPASHSISGHSQPPSYTNSYLNDPTMASYFAQRMPPSGSTSVPAATPGSAFGELSPAVIPTTSKYEEAVFWRAELANVKKENETLKERIRELERTVRERRSSSASRGSQSISGGQGRTRSDSVSTTASANVAASNTVVGGVSIAPQREGRDRPRVVSMLSASGSVAVGVPEDEVKVGESAASAGLNRERAA
ncbi:hypothetical protein QBC39DRAFT_253275 [Podospora conica]|nr:hypothetical protein QBC39DRAFT_253275 [Schizothecium conicum]